MSRVQVYATEEELFAAVRRHRAQMTRGPSEPMRTMLRKLTGSPLLRSTSIERRVAAALTKHEQDFFSGKRLRNDDSTPTG